MQKGYRAAHDTLFASSRSLFTHPALITNQNWVHLNLLWETQRLQITGPEQLLHHFGAGVEHMLQCRLTSLLISGAAMINRQLKKRGVERHPFTEPNKVDI